MSSTVEIGRNALLAASVCRHGECYAIFARRRSAELRPRSYRRRGDVSLVRNADGPYRAGGEYSGRGTANQNKSRDHEVMHACMHYVRARLSGRVCFTITNVW